MNYIQILYLCILKQPEPIDFDLEISCELHSNLVSLHSETTSRPFSICRGRLWITFKSCIFAFWNNMSAALLFHWLLWITFKSCIFAFWNNALHKLMLCHWLWITFKSCIFAFWNNNVKINLNKGAVVNYIQILYLCILKQLAIGRTSNQRSCELHSNLVSLHSETTPQPEPEPQPELWITFKSCIFAFWNNHKKSSHFGSRLWITFKSCIFAFWNNFKPQRL